ncbi:MAG: carboxypeptidase M32 [Planctomycetota bacterium]
MFDHPALLQLTRSVVRIGRLRSTLGLLGWDQETMMPPAGTPSRAAAIGDLTEVVHRMATAPELGDQLAAAEAVCRTGEDLDAKALCREVRRDYDRACKVPPELAEEIARTASEAQSKWAAARAQDDFESFRPYLEKLLVLKRREAEAIGSGWATGGTPSAYDVMLDEYEPGFTAVHVQGLVDQVKPWLVELVAHYAPISARTPALAGPFDVERQRKFGLEVIRRMGFDFERGRLDLSTHPFCSGISPRDVRLTARYDNSTIESLFTLVHEAGHGLYEQGLDWNWEGTPLAAAVSLGIHESQSRMWENIVARGRPFWTFFLPQLQAEFPHLQGLGLGALLRAVNRVQPSLIRVEADEVTYNLHVMLRFELERQLVAGEVAVADLPGIWKERMRADLGLVPPTDREGVLQDIHWSFGAFGYFPTYFLGNLFAAQIYAAAQRELPGLEDGIAAGELTPLREWLRAGIHVHGARYSADELCQRVTGARLDPGVFRSYLEGKLRTVLG